MAELFDDSGRCLVCGVLAGGDADHKHEDTVWARARMDCIQDRCENIPFASIGGLTKRDKPQVPKYIKPAEAEEYLMGYTTTAQRMYGEDWRTCEFGWVPVLEIRKDDGKDTPKRGPTF